MDKVILKDLDMYLYYEKLDNGLDVYFLPFENKKSYFITYATYFGSDVLSYETDEKQIHTPPLGIAHFLEHKMFEQEDGIDPFSYFAKSGTDANAATSFEFTEYICSGIKNFENNLKFLLNYVNTPYFTKENVLKEKGIIKQEINMYQDNPNFKLEMALRKAVYKSCSRRYDVAGTVKDILKITKEDLDKCYENFYVPNNMFVLIVGKFPVEKALKIIIENVNSNKMPIPKIACQKEIKKVFKPLVKLKENIEIPKLGYGLKIPTKDLLKNDLELDLYLNILTTILFGSSSKFLEYAKEKNLINNMDYYIESVNNFKVFYLMASSNNIDKLLKLIEKTFNNICICENDFERIKKVWISNEVKMMNQIDSAVNIIFDDIIRYRKIIPNKLEIIRNMNYQELEKIIKKIDFTNISIVKMSNNC